MAPNTGVTKHRTGRTVHTILTGSKYVILLILYGPQLTQPDQMLCLGAMVQWVWIITAPAAPSAPAPKVMY